MWYLKFVIYFKFDIIINCEFVDYLFEYNNVKLLDEI